MNFTGYIHLSTAQRMQLEYAIRVDEYICKIANIADVSRTEIDKFIAGQDVYGRETLLERMYQLAMLGEDIFRASLDYNTHLSILDEHKRKTDEFWKTFYRNEIVRRWLE